MRLYNIKNNCTTTFDIVKIDEIIKNPVILNDYCWTDERCGGKLVFEYPIEEACSKGWKEMLLHLIHKNHLLPIFRARILCKAVENNHHEIVQYLIQTVNISVSECYLEKKSYRDYDDDGNATVNNVRPLWCPLYYAIKGNAVESAKLLIKAGATFDDLSFVHPADKNFEKDKQQTVSESINNGQVTLTNEMIQMIEEQNAPSMRRTISG